MTPRPFIATGRILRRTTCAAAAAALVLAWAAAPGVAASLDAESCNKLKTEQDGLEKGGVRDLMSKGPDWGKANLPPGKLGEVRRIIEIDEQLLFRCAGKPLVVLPPEADPAANPSEEPAPEKGKEERKQASPPPAATNPPAVAPPVAPKGPEKAAPQRKAAVQKDGVASDVDPGKSAAEDAAAKAPVKPKAKPKPKPKEDAYKAPAETGSLFSFK